MTSNFISNCCFEPIKHHDHNGHGLCSCCNENCVPEEEEEDESEEDIVNTMGRLFDAIGNALAENWITEEEDYYLGRYDKLNF